MNELNPALQPVILENEKLVYFPVGIHHHLPDFKPNHFYRALVIIDRQLPEENRFAWSEWLVNTGCLVMDAWGYEATKWDDDVDMTCVMKNMIAEESEHFLIHIIPPQTYHVLTSWYKDETLEEAIWHFKHAAQFEKSKIDWTYIFYFYDEQAIIDVLPKFLSIKPDIL